MKWFRVDLIAIDKSIRVLGYVLSKDARTAIAKLEGFGIRDQHPEAIEVPDYEVPYKLRAFTEATTEELRNVLRSRDWKVTLT